MSEVALIKKADGLVPTTMTEVMDLAELMSKSEMVPKIYQGKPGNVTVAILAGHPLGLNPFSACQSFAVINGTPSLFGDALLGIVRGSGLLTKISETVSENGQVATCYITRRGEDPVCRTFTMDEAKKAGLLGKQGPWQSYPKRMLQMRARAFALRDVFPDILRGIGIAEEIEDIGRTEASVVVVEEPKTLGTAAVKESLKAAVKTEKVAETVVETEVADDEPATVVDAEPETVSKAAEPKEDVDPDAGKDFGTIWRGKLKGIAEPAKTVAKKLFAAWTISDLDSLKTIVEEAVTLKYKNADDLERLTSFWEAIEQKIKQDAA